MTWSPTFATIEPFVVAVVEQFGLGDRRRVAVSALTGGANRLWRFECGADVFVVKELRHERVEQLARRRRAAAFERAVFESGALTMAEPAADVDGELIAVVDDSRGGGPALVRVHRWIDGRRPSPVTPSIASAAGTALSVIHAHGPPAESGSLRAWEQEPLAVIERLGGSPLADLAPLAESLARDALALIADAEARAADQHWVFSHADHKPQNSLILDDGRLAVLDWDECRAVHPRLEVADSALRWSAEADGDQPSAFVAFLHGYGTTSDLQPCDFGKWVADLLGWFAYQSRRVLGDWPGDMAHERTEAEAMSRQALVELDHTLRSVDTWAAWA